VESSRRYRLDMLEWRLHCYSSLRLPSLDGSTELNGGSSMRNLFWCTRTFSQLCNRPPSYLNRTTTWSIKWIKLIIPRAMLRLKRLWLCLNTWLGSTISMTSQEFKLSIKRSRSVNRLVILTWSIKFQKRRRLSRFIATIKSCMHISWRLHLWESKSVINKADLKKEFLSLKEPTAERF